MASLNDNKTGPSHGWEKVSNFQHLSHVNAKNDCQSAELVREKQDSFLNGRHTRVSTYWLSQRQSSRAAMAGRKNGGDKV